MDDGLEAILPFSKWSGAELEVRQRQSKAQTMPMSAHCELDRMPRKHVDAGETDGIALANRGSAHLPTQLVPVALPRQILRRGLSMCLRVPRVELDAPVAQTVILVLFIKEHQEIELYNSVSGAQLTKTAGENRVQLG